MRLQNLSMPKSNSSVFQNYMPIPTKFLLTPFLCAFGIWAPCFRAFQAQNRGFCALLVFGTPVFRVFEHKIEVFVRFWSLKPPFSGISSTKSRFLCAFDVRNPHFRAFRAQNRGFCALFDFGTPVFGRFEHKIGVFVLGCRGSGTCKMKS